MKIVSKIILASALALSIVAPAFAYEGDTPLENSQMSTMSSRAQHVVGKRARAHRAIDANASVPVEPPASAPASGPENFGYKYFHDLGIGSQS